MKQFEFAIVASGLDHEADDFEDRIFAAGCDDATVSFARGAIILQFSREADTLAAAIGSAIADVTMAGATVDRVEPDHPVSLSDIAARAGLSRAAVSLYVKGDRGRDFPHPVARVTTESPLWDWSEVAQWLHGRHQVREDAVRDAAVHRRVNEEIAMEHRREPA